MLQRKGNATVVAAVVFNSLRRGAVGSHRREDLNVH